MKLRVFINNWDTLNTIHLVFPKEMSNLVVVAIFETTKQPLVLANRLNSTSIQNIFHIGLGLRL